MTLLQTKIARFKGVYNTKLEFLTARQTSKWVHPLFSTWPLDSSTSLISSLLFMLLALLAIDSCVSELAVVTAPGTNRTRAGLGSGLSTWSNTINITVTLSVLPLASACLTSALVISSTSVPRASCLLMYRTAVAVETFSNSPSQASNAYCTSVVTSISCASHSESRRVRETVLTQHLRRYRVCKSPCHRPAALCFWTSNLRMRVSRSTCLALDHSSHSHLLLPLCEYTRYTHAYQLWITLSSYLFFSSATLAVWSVVSLTGLPFLHITQRESPRFAMYILLSRNRAVICLTNLVSVEY